VSVRQLVGVALVLLLGGCGEEPAMAPEAAAKVPVQWNLQAKSISQADAERALDIFLKSCPDLGQRAGNDIESIRVRTTDEYADHRLRLGWKTSFEVSVALRDDLKTLPNFTSDGSGLSGQTLWYNLGGGLRPGALSGKRAAQALCGFPMGEGADTFKSISALGFLDSPS